jgi:hypothetical protein
VPWTADSVASPRLVYGGLDLSSPERADQAYAALYSEVEGSGELGRVTFEGLDAVRGSRGEHLPFDADVARFTSGDWVFVVDGSAWLRERHDYETRHYATPLLDTHRHYLFVFHDEFVEAIAVGIWLDLADRANPFAPPVSHPLQPFDVDMPCERFTSVDGLEWELRRSPRPDTDLIGDSQYCSQRLFQFNLLLDDSKPGSGQRLDPHNRRRSRVPDEPAVGRRFRPHGRVCPARGLLPAVGGVPGRGGTTQARNGKIACQDAQLRLVYAGLLIALPTAGLDTRWASP